MSVDKISSIVVIPKKRASVNAVMAASNLITFSVNEDVDNSGELNENQGDQRGGNIVKKESKGGKRKMGKESEVDSDEEDADSCKSSKNTREKSGGRERSKTESSKSEKRGRMAN